MAWYQILFGIISSLRCGVWSSYVGLGGYGCPTMIRKQLIQLDPFDALITLQSCQEIYINIAFDSVMFGSYLYNIISRCRYTIAAVDCMCSCSSGLHVCWGLFRQSEYWYPIFDTSRLPVAIPGPTMMSFLVYRSLYSLGYKFVKSGTPKLWCLALKMNKVLTHPQMILSKFGDKPSIDNSSYQWGSIFAQFKLVFGRPSWRDVKGNEMKTQYSPDFRS